MQFPLLGRLNARIVIVVSCVLLATGVSSGWMVARNQTSSLMAAMRTDSVVMAKNIAEICAHHLLVQDYAGLESQLLLSVELPDARRVQVSEPDGAVILDVTRQPDGKIRAGFGIARITPPASASAALDAAQGRLEIWEPIVAGSVLGWLKMEFSLDAIHELQAAAFKETLLLAVAWMLLSAALIVLVLRPMVRAIGRLTLFAQQLDRRDGAQIILPGQPLEIEALAKSLNDASLSLMSTERELADERERLRASEALYRSVVDSMVEGVWVQSTRCKIIAVNPAAEKIEGCSAAQMLGKTPTELHREFLGENGGPFPEDSLPCARALLTGEAQREITLGVRRPDTSIAWLSINAQLVLDKDGRPSAVVSTFHDITKRRRAEEEIRRLNQDLERRVAMRTAQLENANQELEAFAYSVSHDLRAPLRHIGGYAQLLREQSASSLDEESRQYLSAIADSAKRMGAMIEDLLSFSRMARAGLSAERIDLAALARDVIAELAPDVLQRNITWTIGDLPEVSADRAMLRMVLTNLLTNALKFTRPRSHSEIEIGVAPGGENEVVIYVRDNGVGFDMANAGKLFGVFQRLHRDDQFEGTGIGLASVRRIIARQGGRTWAEGEVGRGATFYFSLPQAPQYT